MSAHHTGDLESSGPDQVAAPPRGSTGAGLRGRLVLVLVPLLVLALVACAYLAFRAAHPNEDPFNPFSGVAQEQGDQDRGRVTAAAQQFALRMDNVDGAKFDDYLKSINQLLTTKAQAKNKEVFDTLRQSYAAAKVQGTGKVLISGIADLDDDSATVLVAHDASVKTAQGNLEHHYRWNVELVKVDGTWLVDNFDPVN